MKQALAEIEGLARDAVNAQDTNSMPRSGKFFSEAAKTSANAFVLHCGQAEWLEQLKRCLKVGYCSKKCQVRAPSGSATRQRVVPTDRHSFVVCQ